MSAIDEVLEQFAKTGPEFGPGLANHGPMAAEALVALGRDDAVAAWAEWYAPRLGERPRERNRIEPAAWREALGDVRRVGDWQAFLARELKDRPWRDVLEAWTARLAPGIMAGATHGVIRTAHAVRSLERSESAPRTAELGDALAYWAARYQELPSAPPASGSLSPSQALASVALLDESRRSRGLIFDAVRRIDAESFAPAINLVATQGDAGTFVSDVTRTFARHYLANASHSAIALIHCVTAPSALRTLAPHLRPETVHSAMRYTWQACAAIYAAYVRANASPPAHADRAADASDLVERAVAARDEHAIKFTEACLREHAIAPDAAFLAAASDAVVRLRAR